MKLAEDSSILSEYLNSKIIVQNMLCFLLLSSALPIRTGFVTQQVAASMKLHVRYMLKHTAQWHTEDREQSISRGL